RGGGVVSTTNGATANSREAAVWEALRAVPDPEIPVIDIVELGIVRSVVVDDDGVAVTLTPTFAACPAMRDIVDDVASAIERLGEDVRVTTTLHPPWSSDQMTDGAREKLR